MASTSDIPEGIAHKRPRWLLARACLQQELQARGSMETLARIPGVLGRLVRRTEERGVHFNPALLQSRLDALWNNSCRTNPGFATRLLEEVEIALAHHPRALLSFLRLVRKKWIVPGEVEALVCMAFLSCPPGPDREKLIGHVRAALRENVAVREEPSPETPGHYIPPSQRDVYDALCARGELFFDPPSKNLKIAVRLNPLVAGPTGAGKTFIVEQAARRLGAKFIKICFGDWVPVGAADAVPTNRAILNLLRDNERVVLLLDELCKMRGDVATGWSRSATTDIWQLLDRNPGFTEAPLHANLPSNARELLATRLWIVGAGTWQHIHSAPRTAGFGQTSRTTFQSRIAQDRDVPPELLLRFNPQILELRYPLQNETEAIYEASGITDLARSAGVELDPDSHDWSRGGMRSLEDLATTLLLAARQRRTRHV